MNGFYMTIYVKGLKFNCMFLGCEADYTQEQLEKMYYSRKEEILNKLLAMGLVD